MSPRTPSHPTLLPPPGRCPAGAARRAPATHPPLFVCVIGRWVLVFVVRPGPGGSPENESARRARPVEVSAAVRRPASAPATEAPADFPTLNFSSDCIKLPRPGLRWQP